MIKPLLKAFLKKPLYLVSAIFLFGIFIRFLYFPGNIYFGYDQARDAFISQEILHGHPKIVGPTTSTVGLNHGALFYYLYAPIFLIGGGDPTSLSVFLRIYNAAGVFLIYLIAKNLFGKKEGLLASFLYTISYEQTQYAIFMTHPALAVLSVLLFYLGLSMFYFKNQKIGLVLAITGFGLSFQFHYVLINLALVFTIFGILFWKKIPKLDKKTIILSIIALLATLSTYIIAEIKFGFKTFSIILSIFKPSEVSATAKTNYLDNFFSSYLPAVYRFITDNFFSNSYLTLPVLLVFLVLSFFYLAKKDFRQKIIFLAVWLIIGTIPYLVASTFLYFYAIGASISLLVFGSFILVKVFEKNKILFLVLLAFIVYSNLMLITINNPSGPNNQINVQSGMLLTNEKKAVDYMYEKAAGKDFAVNALTMPLYINTTWSYLFEWYGQKKYGSLPVWGGNVAGGYPGNLKINSSRSTLPFDRFLIIEPTRGIESRVDSYVKEEGYFTNVLEEKSFGEITVKYQNPK